LAKERNSSRWKELMADIFELPRDVIMNLPRITIVGNQKVLLENHRGIIHYDCDKIRIGIKGGELIISGRDLQVQRIMVEEIHIKGFIQSMHFEE